ncbi:MAG: helix-turn-helix domain-containing protein [Candidatus Melainabacteria bacterium]|nr:MAG: helix-turn-helix domain-containing protein [Candidatus Melainabacteria bacterium]
MERKLKNYVRVCVTRKKKLAELADIDGKHLSKIETGVHLPTYKTLKKLSEILNFNLQDMDSISDKDKMTDHNPIYQKIFKIVE